MNRHKTIFAGNTVDRVLSFLHLKRANIANLKADVFCFGRFELKTDFLGYLKGRVIAV